MSEFTLDLSKLTRALDKSPAAVNAGAKTALGDIKDDWLRTARDIAPIDKGNLRQQMHGDVVNPGASGFVEIESNATQDTGGKRFNYAYYIHEKNAGGRSLRTPGTVKKYLDESLKSRQATYQEWLEDEVKAELKKAGW